MCGVFKCVCINTKRHQQLTLMPPLKSRRNVTYQWWWPKCVKVWYSRYVWKAHCWQCTQITQSQYSFVTQFLPGLFGNLSHGPQCPWTFRHLLWEYRIQHGAYGPLYVTSSYSTWIFCRGVSGFATDCPCGVWCRGLTTPPACWSTFWKSNSKQQLGCRFDIMDY